MASNDHMKALHCHGLSLDPQNSRVLCRYCRKVISGFNCLEHHLGRLGTYVMGCPVVPIEVNDFFRCKLIDTKMGEVVKERGDAHHLSLSSARKRLAENDGLRIQTHATSISDSGSGSVKLVCASSDVLPPLSSRRDPSNSSVEVLDACTTSGKLTGINCCAQSSLSKRQKCALLNHLGETNMRGGAFDNDDGATTSIRKDQDNSIVLAKRCIGRFLFENAIDFSAVESSSFKKMMELAFGSVASRFLPSTKELKGWILFEEMTEIQQYVRDVRQSWEITGCSIVLDGWVKDMGHDFFNVVVDCPRGAIYLKSLDISDAVGNVDALEEILDNVLQEVGIQNMVQIISYTKTECMEALGKRLMNKHKSIFWTISAAHCISLMLERIGTRKAIRRIMQKAKSMITFVNSNSEVLKLMRRYTNIHELMKPCKIKAAADYMMLENILMQKEYIVDMFGSSEWKNSVWATSIAGIYITTFVVDASFWDDVTVAVKASVPLIKLLSLVNENNPDMGWIYEWMDQVKETIRDDLGQKTSKFKPFWDIIDEIWNGDLHSPLHTMGFILNPRLRYSRRFIADKEVISGSLITLVKMIGDPQMQDLICLQLDEYHDQKGDFKMGLQSLKHDNISPVEWWSQFGGHCPELQKLAIKVLSQTCNGGSAYELRRDLAEKLLSTGINYMEKNQLSEFSYVHYNLQLKQYEKKQ